MKNYPDADAKQYAEIGKGEKVFFTVVILFILWLIGDICLYLFLHNFQKKLTLFYRFEVPTDEKLEGFYKKYFHPRWGWDISKDKQDKLGDRKSHDYDAKEQYTIKCFGDSFTYGYGVEDNETFSYVVEEKTGWECLNYGVDGYGTDQALLKYKDNNVKTTYTVLGILHENIGRCMTVWWSFYQRGFSGTKPRFVISNDDVVFIDNPVKDYNDLRKLQDIGFINSLKKYDYWQKYYESINAPPRLKWPATFVILPHFDFFIKNFVILVKNYLSPTYEGEISKRKVYHLYNEESEGMKIMRYIVREFIKTAHMRGEIPIILVFPFEHTVDTFQKFGKKPYQSLIDYLQMIQCHFIDFGEVLVHEDYSSYYQADTHFSPKGNERVADQLIDYIRQIEQNQ